MNRNVGQASRLSGGAGFQPAPAGKMPALLHRQDACATCNPGSWSQCMRKNESGLSMIRNAELQLGARKFKGGTQS